MDSMSHSSFFADLGFHELNGEQVETDNIVNLTGEDITLLMKDRKYAYLPRLKKANIERTILSTVQDDDHIIYEALRPEQGLIPEETKGIMVLVDRKIALALIGRKDIFVPIMTDISDTKRGWKIAKGLYRFV